jgi:hypothetical protein
MGLGLRIPILLAHPTFQDLKPFQENQCYLTFQDLTPVRENRWSDLARRVIPILEAWTTMLRLLKIAKNRSIEIVRTIR